MTLKTLKFASFLSKLYFSTISKATLFMQDMSIAVCKVRVCFPRDFTKSLPGLPYKSLPAPAMVYLLPLATWIASQNGTCCSPRTLSSVWRDEWSISTPMLQVVIVQPSYHTSSGNRLRGTTPWFGSAAISDYLSAGGY